MPRQKSLDRSIHISHWGVLPLSAKLAPLMFHRRVPCLGNMIFTIGQITVSVAQRSCGQNYGEDNTSLSRSPVS